MPAAVLTVHQLRFMLAFGGSSGEELEKEGHQYLSALAAPIAMSVAIVVGLFFARLASAWREGEREEAIARGDSSGEAAPWGALLPLRLRARRRPARGPRRDPLGRLAPPPSHRFARAPEDRPAATAPLPA